MPEVQQQDVLLIYLVGRLIHSDRDGNLTISLLFHIMPLFCMKMYGHQKVLN